jgi:hypothetical protein
VVRLQEIIRAPKVDIKVGVWHNGKVPKGSFPMAKKAYSIGNSYQWCVISFNCLSLDCLVLIVLNEPKEKYEAILGVLAEGQLRILCSYEYHATEPGWHCHAACGDVNKVPKGCMRGPWIRRIPKAHATHSRLDFAIDGQQKAVRFAIGCYRIESRGTLL